MGLCGGPHLGVGHTHLCPHEVECNVMLYTVARAEALGWGPNAAAFATFMNAINQRITLRFDGLTIDDVPDWHWANAFNSGLPYATIVEDFVEFLKEEGYA